MTVSLLVVEDDHAVRTFLADNLTADGFELAVAGTVRDAQRQLVTSQPALALIDVGLPDGSGLELVQRARGGGDGLDASQRFLVLSGRAAEQDRVRSLAAGADDFLAKPFSYAELLLRVRGLLRRGPLTAARPPVIAVGPLRVDAATRTVQLRGELVDVSTKEFALLRVLATEPDRVHTKADLLREIWGHTMPQTTRTLDSHACRLRRKLRVAGDPYLVNVWGVGYRLLDPVPA